MPDIKKIVKLILKIMNKNEKFILMGGDGVWEKLSN